MFCVCLYATCLEPLVLPVKISFNDVSLFTCFFAVVESFHKEQRTKKVFHITKYQFISKLYMWPTTSEDKV